MHFILRLFDTSNVLEGDAIFILREHARFRFAEIERTLARHLDLRAEEEVEDDQKQNDGQKAQHR